MRIARLAMLTWLLVALSAPVAFAQSSPTGRGYDETLGVVSEIDSVAAARPSQAQVAPAQPLSEGSGTLPFTGADVGIVILMGAALIGTGFALRRSTRRNSA